MTAEAQATEPIEVDDLDTFVRLLAGWHSNKIQRLEHMLNVPDGITIQIEEDVEEPLTGDLRRGFRAGILVALGELGKLPFEAEIETNEDTQPN